MTKIKMLVMGALMAGVVAGAAPALADETPYFNTEYGYQDNPRVEKRVSEPSLMKKHHHKKKHHKKMKKKHYYHRSHEAKMSNDTYPDDCIKPPCKGTTN
ncbi:MAG TPA: hypothetical protein VEF76_09290 [Patescibacteria group bacterium]|nr:hypothetical protein [Patescibacteria group bacterium]